jgi:protein TonB
VTDANLANLIVYSAQVLIVVATAACAAGVVRLPMARARVAYWRLIVALCLALPFLAQPADRVVFIEESAGNVVTPVAIVVGGAVEPEPRVRAATAVGWLLVVGAAARGAWLGIGILALIRLRRGSDAATLPDDVDVLRKAVAPSAAIRWHSEIAQPVAFGWLRPVVLLPRRAADLSADAQRAVVCHELLHVARRDWLWMLSEEAIKCLLWFHPAIWFAVAKLQLSREELVDEEVVRITAVRQPYVRALVLFAAEPTAFAAATPFIRRRHLVSRIRQLSEDHTMSRLRIVCGAVILLAVTVGSGWAAVSTLPLGIDGTTLLQVPKPTGPGDTLVPQIEAGTLSVADQQGRNQDAEADRPREARDKLAALAELAAAAARLQAAKNAIEQERRYLQVSMQPVVTTVTQKVPPVYPEAAKGHGVEAVVTVRVTVGIAGEVTSVETMRTRLTTERDINDPAFWATQPSKLFAQAAEDAVRQWRFEPTGASRRFEVPVPFGEQNQMVFVPIGRRVQVADGTPTVVTYAPETAQGDRPARLRSGSVRPPRLVTSVEPVYPPAARAANIQGAVILEIVIGTDGTVKEGRVLRSISLLDQAALDAVVQWKYEPTLLNGAPVEVIATVTIDFTVPPQ